MHTEVHRAFSAFWASRGSPASRAAHRAAAFRFREEYDGLAIPGGVRDTLRRLSLHEPRAIETAIQFLEADPWFHRSGYLKQKLCRQVKKAPLTEAQRSRLRQVVLDRVVGRDRREFRSYVQLARVVRDPQLVEQLEGLESLYSRGVSRRARWMLDALRAPTRTASTTRFRRYRFCPKCRGVEIRRS
jgi:hypothetical protein